jgi:hypothetical protein
VVTDVSSKASADSQMDWLSRDNNQWLNSAMDSGGSVAEQNVLRLVPDGECDLLDWIDSGEICEVSLMLGVNAATDSVSRLEKVAWRRTLGWISRSRFQLGL